MTMQGKPSTSFCFEPVQALIAAVIFSLCLLVSAGCQQTAPGNASASASSNAGEKSDPQTVSSPSQTSNTPSADAVADNLGSPVKLSYLDEDGFPELIKKYEGKPLLIDCWGTSCPPCVAAFPKLVALHKKMGSEIHFVSLSFDYDGSGPDALEQAYQSDLAFLTAQGALLDNYIAKKESDELCKEVGIAAIPAVLLYGPDGKLVQKFVEKRGEPEIYERVEEALRSEAWKSK